MSLQYNKMNSPRHSSHSCLLPWPLHTHTPPLPFVFAIGSEISQVLGKEKIHLKMLHKFCLTVDTLDIACTVTQQGAHC